MVQQYFSLEEAARALGISTEELNGMRERSEIRAFADRGTWKFRSQDVQEAARQRGLGSSPDMPLGERSSDAGAEAQEEDQVLLSEQEIGGSDSSSRVVGMSSTGATPGDSDIHLAADEPREPGSDSDVKLAADEPLKPGSDSDVKLVDSGAPPSDSDVRLVPEEPSSDEERGSDFELSLEEDESTSKDSGVQLGGATDSDITLAPGDSGVSLSQPSDSGISLEQPTDLTLGGGGESGSKSDDDATVTLDAVDQPEEKGSKDDLLGTDFEIPLVDEESEDSGTATDLGDDSDFELAGLDEGMEESGSRVIALEDADEIDERAATAIGAAAGAGVGAGEEGLLESEEDLEAAPEDMAFDEAETFGGPATAPGPAVVAKAETEWGAFTFSFLCVAALLLAIAGMMMFDLMRNIWSWDRANPLSSQIIELFRGLF